MEGKIEGQISTALRLEQQRHTLNTRQEGRGMAARDRDAEGRNRDGRTIQFHGRSCMSECGRGRDRGLHNKDINYYTGVVRHAERRWDRGSLREQSDITTWVGKDSKTGTTER